MAFDVAICFAHLVLKSEQITIDGKVIYSGALLSSSRRNRRYNDFNPLFLCELRENTHLVKMFVAEQSIFSRQNDGADNAAAHVPVKAIQLYSLVNALLSRYASALIIEAHFWLCISVKLLAIILQP